MVDNRKKNEMTQTIVLYQFWRSSASWRVRWALGIKNIPFESVPIDITAGQQFTEEHRERNPVGHVPALFIDGRCLAESVAIIEYLNERFPEPNLFPTDLWARARVRQLIELVNAGIQPLQNLIAQHKHSSDLAEQREFAKFFNVRGLTAIERLLTTMKFELGDGPFAAGNLFTAAELFLIPQVATARRFGIDLSLYPRLLTIEANALATPHAKAALPENQPGAPK